MTDYLSIGHLLRIHGAQRRRYGGGAGIRERGRLEAARARPAMTFGGVDLYPDLPAKAAALMHSLIVNPSFLDGNKRVGGSAAVVFLRLNGAGLKASPDAVEKLAMAVASGRIGMEELTIWFRQRVRKEA